jgi:hypothetical protein
VLDDTGELASAAAFDGGDSCHSMSSAGSRKSDKRIIKRMKNGLTTITPTIVHGPWGVEYYGNFQGFTLKTFERDFLTEHYVACERKVVRTKAETEYLCRVLIAIEQIDILHSASFYLIGSPSHRTYNMKATMLIEVLTLIWRKVINQKPKSILIGF